ncbi:MAG TPA: gephyrin-like molybdotransferase Glp [Candidatus Saccharimonadales bacterium]|nr:gephyrin-like molybdotransferase Glp [Candidatus Saccharimonadales bacterium]
MTDVANRLATSGRPGLLSVEAAQERVLASIPGPLPSGELPTAEAFERILAEPVLSRTALPPWDNSAMDGYAIRAADTVAATESTPVRLTVISEVRAGTIAEIAVAPGTAIRIATGAPLPADADAVVAVEETTPLDAMGATGPRGRDAAGPVPAAVLVHQAVAVAGSVRRRGSDLADGAAILTAGTELTAAAIALAAGAGVSLVRVHRLPRVAVLATGDEVRSAGHPLGAAGIPDANGPGLRALVRASGGIPIDLGVAADRLDDVLARLRRGIAEADAVIVSGGVSVGPYDVVRTAFETVGRVDLWRVAVQPGKPFAFGTAVRPAGDAAGAGSAVVLLFGLPGNPVSSFVTFELFVRPAIRRLAGRRALGRPADRAVLDEPVTKSLGRRGFQRVVAARGSSGEPLRDREGRVHVRLAGGQGSHVLSALAAADALAIVPEAVDGLPAGAEVALWWLDRG